MTFQLLRLASALKYYSLGGDHSVMDARLEGDCLVIVLNLEYARIPTLVNICSLILYYPVLILVHLWAHRSLLYAIFRKLLTHTCTHSSLLDVDDNIWQLMPAILIGQKVRIDWFRVLHPAIFMMGKNPACHLNRNCLLWALQSRRIMKRAWKYRV